MRKPAPKPALDTLARRGCTYKYLNSKKSRQVFGASKIRKKAGQAAIEYVLLAAVSTLIFGYMFHQIRLSVFRLWICEITPRVQAPSGCDWQSRGCYKEKMSQDSTASQCQQMSSQ